NSLLHAISTPCLHFPAQSSFPSAPAAGSMDPAKTAADLSRQLGPGLKICILGSTSFSGADSEDLVKQVARQLQAALGQRAVFITGGMPGVQETFVKHCGDGRVFNVLPEGEKCNFGVGTVLHAGADMAQRRAVFAHLGDVYVTVEGGPGVAEEARVAYARGAFVLPLIRTGGASSGMFDFPAGAQQRPLFASEERWKLLASKESTTAVSAAALVALVLDFEAARSRPTRSSLAFSTSVLDRKEAARLEHFMVSLATGQEPPWLTPYLRKLGPAFAAANQVAAVACPFLYQFYAGLYKIYKALPQNAACGLWGLGACFFGGRYAAFFAAAEAFKTAGGDQMPEPHHTLTTF
ncbi:unnamed protein product, partial [Polarella glacialis]